MCGGGDCVICFEKMPSLPTNGISMKKWALYKRTGRVNPEKQVEKLKCGHVFHSECIKQWFMKIDSDSSGNCPMCRAKIAFSNKRGLLNRSMYLKKHWKEEKENGIFTTEDFSFSVSEVDSDTDSVLSDTSYQSDISDSPSAFGDSDRESSLDEMDWEDDESDSDWEDSESDSDWEDDESDMDWQESSHRSSFSGNFNPLDFEFNEVYDLSYNRFREVVMLSRRELLLQAEKMHSTDFGKKHQVGNKSKRWLSKQGQDFGCACV